LIAVQARQTFGFVSHTSALMTTCQHFAARLLLLFLATFIITNLILRIYFGLTKATLFLRFVVFEFFTGHAFMVRNLTALGTPIDVAGRLFIENYDRR
jgi:hypothetical protein